MLLFLSLFLSGLRPSCCCNSQAFNLSTSDKTNIILKVKPYKPITLLYFTVAPWDRTI